MDAALGCQSPHSPNLRRSSLPAEKQNHEFTGSVSFVAGSAAGGYGTGSDMSTSFTLERSIFSDGRLAVSGNVAYGETLPSAVVRARYSHRLKNGSEPTMALSVSRFAPADPNLHNAALQALALSAADDFVLGDVLELKFGSELQTIQFLGHLTAFRPYASADFHLSPNTVVEYDYTTSRPDTAHRKGIRFRSGGLERIQSAGQPARTSHPASRVRITRKSASRSELGKNNLQVAMFSDRVARSRPHRRGLSHVLLSGFLLPDMTSGTFSYAGRNLDTNGVRVVLQHKFASDLTATVDYAFGGVLDLSRPDVPLPQAQQWISTERRHALAAKLSGTVARTRTRTGSPPIAGSTAPP